MYYRKPSSRIFRLHFFLKFTFVLCCPFLPNNKSIHSSPRFLRGKRRTDKNDFLCDASTKSDDDDDDDDGAKDGVDDDDDDDDESRVVFCGCVVVRSWDDGVDDGSVLES